MMAKMNIFVLDRDPILAAQYQTNAHTVKMIVESAQMLCNAFSEEMAPPYKRTHYNHPCSKWCRKTKDNYLWLVAHAVALCDEYSYRYDKIEPHKSQKVITWCINNINNIKFKAEGATPFAQVVPEKYKSNNVVETYRNYYVAEKRHLLKYKKRSAPRWLLKKLLLIDGDRDE